MERRGEAAIPNVTHRPNAVLLACSAGEERGALMRVLMQCGLAPVLSRSVRETQATLSGQKVGLIVCAAQLEDGSFRDLLRMVRRVNWRGSLIVASRLGECEEYLEAMRLGAFDLIVAPYCLRDVKPIVQRALQGHSRLDAADEPESTPQEGREVFYGT